MSNFKQEEAKRRMARNKELVEMVRRGEPIAPLVPLDQLFFPPRPSIEKDKNALKFLFDDNQSKGLPKS